ncbi:uncharacterized protein BO97DRAFT_423162 [Aspergillus homomorphus CBS 101889]|uniref:Uncharacterized protein n=1 Tax=Aspergillus homomorphus (strain CBS 101889) TaxID=1450537 RepID=A0A395I667_ASPHC|nr:hypothetical protein BO97DRAFT_423162 [Aspergillus homomorphus CBS 101889]RAL13784.1 hypothetical protein BO97DRAFT_423162 [Aspergillus homomorphus CBS 101889]
MGHAQTSLKRSDCTITSQVSRDLYEEVCKAWFGACKTLPPGAVLHYTIHSLGKTGIQAGKDRGENSMGHEDVARVGFRLYHVRNGAVLAKAQGVLLDFKCTSFAAASQKVLSSYRTDNSKRTQEVAAKYGPEGLFQKLQNGGFLLRDNVWVHISDRSEVGNFDRLVAM